MILFDLSQCLNILFWTQFYETKTCCGFLPFPCPSSRPSHLKIFIPGYIMVISLSLGSHWLKKKPLKYFHFLLLEGIIQDSHFTAQNYDPNLCFCINLPHLASRPACYQLPGPQVTFSPRSSSHQVFKILTSFSSFFSELYIFPEFIINL